MSWAKVAMNKGLGVKKFIQLIINICVEVDLTHEQTFVHRYTVHFPLCK
jgi:hypothetical protein